MGKETNEAKNLDRNNACTSLLSISRQKKEAKQEAEELLNYSAATATAAENQERQGNYRV